MTIDFLTTIIDNYGDAGFAFNLALSLQTQRPKMKIRFFCDNKELFLKLKGSLNTQNIEYFDLRDFEKLTPSPIIFNFFDRTINFEFLHSFPFPITLINFTYFLMHIGVRSLHHTHYTSKNVSVTHYIPSLLPEGGGVIIHPEIEKYKEEIEKNGIEEERKKMFPDFSEQKRAKKWISLFCYADTLPYIQESILHDTKNLYFVFDSSFQGENIINMPFLNILEYQKFLFLCDKNIVRGENSLVAAILAGRPFLWDIYKEHNGAHKEKIEDFRKYISFYTSQNTKEYQDIFQQFNLLGEEKYIPFKTFIGGEAPDIFHILSGKIILENNLLKNLVQLEGIFLQ